MQSTVSWKMKRIAQLQQSSYFGRSESLPEVLPSSFSSKRQNKNNRGAPSTLVEIPPLSSTPTGVSFYLFFSLTRWYPPFNGCASRSWSSRWTLIVIPARKFRDFSVFLAVNPGNLKMTKNSEFMEWNNGTPQCLLISWYNSPFKSLIPSSHQ